MDDPHLRQALGAQAAAMDIHWHPLPRLFAPVSAGCGSFSQWWRRTALAG